MAISYPLSLPAENQIRGISMEAVTAGAMARSPFTLSSQVFAFSGEMWRADVTLKPMRRPDAAAWVAFGLKCRGRFGTFLLGDPFGSVARGTATSASVTGGAGDRTVAVTMSGTLLAGDYIQIGTGADATLHSVLEDQSGSGTLEIWPALRKARAGAAVTTSSPKGVFRLAANSHRWDVDALCVYGLTFAAEESFA
jgi:hypothetical protein